MIWLFFKITVFVFLTLTFAIVMDTAYKIVQRKDK